jgi:hypothetical protein
VLPGNSFQDDVLRLWKLNLQYVVPALFPFPSPLYPTSILLFNKSQTRRIKIGSADNYPVCVLLVNAIAILSEDRFLARGPSSLALPSLFLSSLPIPPVTNPIKCTETEIHMLTE